MACRTCGKSKLRILADKSKAAGRDVHEMGPFPGYEPAHVAPDEPTTLESDDETAKV